jgi:hypothetical protein
MMTHVAKHEAEHKRAGRLVTRMKKCVERDPSEDITSRWEQKQKHHQRRDYSHHADATLDIRQLLLVLNVIVTAR